MTIDIIDYDMEKVELMSRKQKVNLYEAQHRKNRLYEKYNRSLAKIRAKLLKQNVFYSTVYEQIKSQLLSEYEQAVKVIRERVLYEIMRDMQGSLLDVPYLIDYALTVGERYTIVREYYENTYEDPRERFLAFRKDEFAISYLEDMYSTLFDYFTVDV